MLVAAGSLLALALPAAAEGPPAVAASPPWTLHDRDDDPTGGYAVFRRIPPGSESYAYRLEAVVEGPPAAVAEAALATLVDPAAGPANIEKRVLRHDGDRLVIHSHIDLPLVSDRDVVTLVERSTDASTGTHALRWRASDEGPAPADGVVRLPRSDGSWTFSPLPDARTRAVYESHTEIGGSIPGWIVDAMMSDTMVGGLAEVRERVASGAGAAGG